MAGLPTDYNKWEKINASIEPDEEDLARERLKQQKANMTEEEVRRLHDCWEKPEFKQMFHEYAEEVSDPKNKAEQEAYLAQCEAEQRAQERAGEVDVEHRHLVLLSDLPPYTSYTPNVVQFPHQTLTKLCTFEKRFC